MQKAKSAHSSYQVEKTAFHNYYYYYTTCFHLYSFVCVHEALQRDTLITGALLAPGYRALFSISFLLSFLELVDAEQMHPSEQ